MSVWHQVVVTGSEKVLRALLAGLEAGSGKRGAYMLDSDLELHSESFSDRLRDMLGRGNLHAVFAHPPDADLLVSAIERDGESLSLQVNARAEVRAARFQFSAATFAERVAEEVRAAMIADLPAGARVEGLSETETRDPAAHGAELYAPEHEFAYTASGTVVGSFPAVVEVHRRALENDFVEAGPITIETAPIAEE